MNKKWFLSNTFHYSEFKDLNRLVSEKKKKNVKISLCLPTLNEEKTIAKEILIMKSELMTRYPLLDEIVVIDSGSTDNTVEIAETYGADVYQADDILPHLEKHRGKGENLWKALYITEGDIIVYLDADIKNIHHRFAYALIGPLILTDHIKYAKAFYDRPIATGKNKVRPTGGGRVTELVTRPLFSLFFPELTQIIQPLSGEYAGYRELFEKIPFPIGYGIETSMILDIYEKWGLNVIAQVDLERRIHRNQDTKSLGKMSFAILHTFFRRIEKLGLIELNKKLFHEMIQYNLIRDEYEPDIYSVTGVERPPMIELPEYCEKFNIVNTQKSLKGHDQVASLQFDRPI
ncbi:MAG: glucosyl-3-phosphoglycerate synthase [Deltaproteobacteria bacterium]|nr:glucosyl-3-phosphoglycerate synthase [Deltaproteobacteria bacterium]MBW1962377.1 glucosyl-3-phosphoglycerate synthase [Deltaproteobacteria bacterium]MBW1995230.1 glucosyl-3-phosphoglycerate synthase [Deltaproteobacteria bacterium]MBW2151067.1 glucosyl-3-phosphoglycerate synthase [Deltaproteobacteria bacterium]